MLYCIPKLKQLSWKDLVASGHIEGAFVVTTVLTVTIMGSIDIVLYYLKSHKKALDAEILKKNKARFQYEQLKRQLNPHFLFNSLNVLDYLVHTDPERASGYIKKLAGVYRYLLSKESDPVVYLEEEMEFVNMYVNLLEERFKNGLEVSIKIEDQYLKTLVIPCSIQLLIENATKHNIISESSPLFVKVYAKDHYIYVENNYQPRIRSDASTGVGLKNIDGQISALFNKNIEISKLPDKFIVKLPVIENKGSQLFFKTES
jgi:LytS/YehU family sensor histidine kinase